MNAIELLYFLGFIGSAFAVGWLLSKPFGAVGWWVGSILGLICWAGILWAIRLLVNRLGALYPGRPTCSRGKCNAYDYRFLWMKNGGAELECRCGDKYYSKRNRFMTVDEEGVAHPYMRRKHSFAGWEKDDSKCGNQ